MWIWSSRRRRQALLHIWHMYGFSPLWIMLCFSSSEERANRLLQILHSYVFSPEWLCRCAVKCWLFWHLSPHSVHSFLLVWLIQCLLRNCHLAKCWPQALHKYGFNTSSCGCLLLSASVWMSDEVSATKYAQQRVQTALNMLSLTQLQTVKSIVRIRKKRSLYQSCSVL